MEHPKDLGLKMATEEGKAWTDILEGAEKEIKFNKRHILINEKIIELAKEKIEEEAEKLK